MVGIYGFLRPFILDNNLLDKRHRFYMTFYLLLTFNRPHMAYYSSIVIMFTACSELRKVLF